MRRHEGLVEPGSFAADHDPGKDLDPLLIAFAHASVHAHPVAHFEFRDVGLLLLFGEGVDDVHISRFLPRKRGRIPARAQRIVKGPPRLLLLAIDNSPAKNWLVTLCALDTIPAPRFSFRGRNKFISMKKLILSLALLSLIPASRVVGQWSSDPMVNLGVAVKPNDQVQPKIRQTPNDGCYISWFDNDPSGHPPFGYDVFMQRLDAAGVAQWVVGGIRFADLGMSSTQDYGLDVDADGNALLVFLDDRRESGTTVVTMKVDRTGAQHWGHKGRQVAVGPDFWATRKSPRPPTAQLWRVGSRATTSCSSESARPAKGSGVRPE